MSSHTPRPVPNIQDEVTFSRKKRPKFICDYEIAPRSPIKSAPPISRIFRHRKGSTPGAHAVSFRRSQTEGDVNIQSPLYKTFDQLYFDQCFTKLSRVGSGSFGEVWKVQSKEDGKMYAVKKSRERFRGDFDRKQRLEEVNKNEHIPKHGNCVQFYKAWEELDHVYIQSELCEMSLKDYAESVRLVEEKEIWNMIVDLCCGLKNLHDAEFAHMDIKPANLFLGRDGCYKIGDFGLVVELTRDLSDAMDGDAKYLAPEIMEGKFSKSADIFSLGITLLELACSLELPKGGLLWHQLRNKKLPFEFTEGLSDDLILLISQMMEPNPDKRPTVDEILKMSSVMRAKSQRCSMNYLTKITNLLTCIMLVIMTTFTFILSLVTKRKPCISKSSISSQPLPAIQSGENSNFGHESLTNHDISVHNSSISTLSNTSMQSVSVSPLFSKNSPLFQPISDKRETKLWKVSSPDNSQTPTNLFGCSQLSDCSPPSAILSDRIVRSRLFNCSSDEEDVFDLDKVPKNLMCNFDQE